MTKEEWREELLAEQVSDQKKIDKLYNDFEYAFEELVTESYEVAEIDSLCMVLVDKMRRYGHEITYKDIEGIL